MRCSDCKHWTAPEGDEWEPIRNTFGTCEQTPHVEDMTVWVDDDYTRRVIKPEYADRTAAASDASGYSAHLRTTPSHFCAMFAVKGPTP